MPRPVPRRTFVAGTCAAACGAALSACTTYPVGSAPAAPTAPEPPQPAEPGAPAAALAATADVPVGGGTVFPDQDVVVTQPTSGEFRAFSATCTHQGCAVGDVSDGTINCPCHGSRFALDDGAVVGGPAETPLPERAVTVVDGRILLT